MKNPYPIHDSRYLVWESAAFRVRVEAAAVDGALSSLVRAHAALVAAESRLAELSAQQAELFAEEHDRIAVAGL